MALKHCVVVPL